MDALAIFAALSSLTFAEREVFVDVVVLGHSQAAISRRMKISKQRTSQLLRDATRKIRSDELVVALVEG